MSKSRIPNPESREGWHGWDAYAPFYDWENAQTLGRRDVPFWRRVAAREGGRVLELGCGTGRVSLPLAAAGVDLVGIDRSEPMLARAVQRAARRSMGHATAPARIPSPESPRIPNPGSRIPFFVRGDIRALPFAARSFGAVLAPYGILQSLIRPRDLSETLASVARVLGRGGRFGIDLVPDVPKWREYRDRVQLRGRSGGADLTLVESVSQDRRRGLTTFRQCYIERRGTATREHRFDLVFRTLSVRAMTRRLERAGFQVEAVLGDYDGGPWDDRADVWIILARKG
jgi:ubiquinone/menaquinone biosynthesis C-methylase UbiE